MPKPIIMDHPLVQHKLAVLRDKNTGSKEFRELINELATLMCYDATEQSVHNVRTRLINFFLLYIKDRDTPVVPLSQERLAAAINASRVQVARVCSDLKKEGLILTGKRQITIPSREALARSTRHS